MAKAYARTQNKNGVKKQIKILDPFSQKMPNLAFTLASICDTVGLLEETKRYLMTFERLAKAQKVSLERLPRTYLSLGMIDYKQRHFSAAADWFSQVDQSSEFFPQSRLFLAQALAAEKHFDEAIEVLDKTKVNDQLKTEFLHKRAQILYEADRLPQAYEAMKRLYPLTKIMLRYFSSAPLLPMRLNALMKLRNIYKMRLNSIPITPISTIRWVIFG